MRLKDALNAYSVIVKNPMVFSLDYVPQKIYEKAEIIHVRNHILNFLRLKLPQNTLIIGPSGTGKTLSVLKYKKELSQDFPDFEMKYVNCRDAYTSYRVITKLTPIPLRGISLDEAFDSFFSKQKKHLLLVLDEVDKLRDHEILYNFSRIKEVTHDFKYSISLFLISNNPRWSENLESSIASSLRLEPEIFGSYTAPELTRIVTSRAREGLIKGTYDTAVLDYIAAKTTKEAFADARVAIITLLKAARRSEVSKKKRLLRDHVDEIFDKVNKDLEVENLSRLNATPFAILYACIRCDKKSAKEIYTYYQRLSDRFAQRSTVKYVQFHNNLSYLQSQNVIQLWKTKVGNYFMTEIKPNISLKAVEKEFEKRMKQGVL